MDEIPDLKTAVSWSGGRRPTRLHCRRSGSPSKTSWSRRGTNSNSEILCRPPPAKIEPPPLLLPPPPAMIMPPLLLPSSLPDELLSSLPSMLQVISRLVSFLTWKILVTSRVRFLVRNYELGSWQRIKYDLCKMHKRMRKHRTNNPCCTCPNRKHQSLL